MKVSSKVDNMSLIHEDYLWRRPENAAMPVPVQIQNVLNDVDKQLHGDGPVHNILATIEQKSGVRRLHIVLGVAAMQALYLIFGHFAELVCNFMGFIYPAYVSIKAIESPTKNDDTQWLTYWVVFAVFSVAEFFSQQILAIFPVYWLSKSLFLLWLYLPSTMGASKVYHKLIRPIALKHQTSIDHRIENLAEKAKDAIRNATHEVNSHLD
ncbi:TB2/DP1, HVA22 family [Dictyocaulus viviparus]|uniref:Receptor expression-enhancing protein n=1 Tax=Dictyocaulus viviparus TaxID=29172 RepID=A0A0D8Y573_DICVI|nr:TB2/DP1, HVA22 family [Dictyocaulus viviparus]